MLFLKTMNLLPKIRDSCAIQILSRAHLQTHNMTSLNRKFNTSLKKSKAYNSKLTISMSSEMTAIALSVIL
jgi:hypothetical protein